MNSILLPYFVKKSSDDPVLLSVTLGHGQKGITRISIDNIPLGEPRHDSFENLSIGLNKALPQKVMLCTVTVTDIQPHTNETSVSFILKGGNDKIHQTLSRTSLKDGGVVFYSILIIFL